MRWKHWFKAIFSGTLVAVSSWTAQAQPPMDGAMPYPADGYGSAPMYGGGGGPPEMYSPWPQISPYANSFSQQLNEGGVWSQSQNGMQRRYRLTLDYFTGRTRSSEGYVGNRDAQNYVEVIRPQVGGQQGGGGQQGQQNILNQFTTNPLTGQRGYKLFGAVDLKDRDRPLKSEGFQAIWGYDRADDSGLRIGFLFNNDNSFLYNARDKLPETRGTQQAYAREITEQLHILNELQSQGNAVAAAQLQAQLLQQGIRNQTEYTIFYDPSKVLSNNLHNLNGLPLDDGTIEHFSDGTTFGGVTVPYDLQFKVDIRSELYGGQADWVLSPIVNWKFLRVRPSVGARYFYLREGFSFLGVDSGLSYGSAQQGGGGGGQNTLGPDIKLHSPPDGIDNNSDFIVDNAGTVEGGQGQGGGGQQQQVPVFQTFRSFHDHFRYPITSYLNNDADSHLGGAVVGLMYDLGGESFTISGATRVGLLANYTQINMKGDNIGMHTRDSNLLLATPDDATPNSFTHSKIRTHVSPMFEQSITAQAPLFRYVPILRRFAVFDKAQFRAGYSILLIGQVTDTGDSILWQGNPSLNLFPKIHENRHTFSTHSYNFGVTWEY